MIFFLILFENFKDILQGKMRQFIQKLQVFTCENTFILLVFTDYCPFTHI